MLGVASAVKGVTVTEQRDGSLKSKLLVGLLWLNFIFLWARVYTITSLKDVTDSLNYLTNLILAYGLIVALWIMHNIRIYRAKGPRIRSRTVEFSDARDCMNQQINRVGDVMREQEITIEVIGAEKFFVAENRTLNEPVLTREGR
jgi:hypothetical protein